MTPLRQRMLDALELRGMAARTREAYIDAVARLARHYGRSPDVLSATEVQQYLLHLLRERHLARSSVNQYGCAYRFLYGSVLGLDGERFQIPLAPAPQRLPEILSRQEIARLFAAACHDKARSFLMLAYGTGLRLSELCALRVADIDSAADRMCIRVVQGKGAKDRYVPLAPDVLALLRRWWRTARPAPWLFAAARDSGRQLDPKTPQRWYRGAAARAGMTEARFHWPSNPWVKGSYACYLPGQWTSICAAEGEPVGELYFCGEHCSLPAQGYMEGGCETGEGVAAAILASRGRAAA